MNTTQQLSHIKMEYDWVNLLQYTKKYLKPKSILYPIAFGEPHPRSYANIRSNHSLYVGPELAELRWIFLSLYINYEAILRASSIENCLRRQLLIGDYEQAQTSLSDLEHISGFSFRSLFYRFYLLERTKGKTAHKQFLNELNNELKNNFIVAVIADFLSKRAEIDISAETFEAELANLKNYLKTNPDYFEYIRLLIEPIYRPSVEINVISLRCSNLPLLDRYHALRTLSAQLKEPPLLTALLKCKTLPHHDIDKLINLFSICFPSSRFSEPIDLTKEETSLVELYTSIERKEYTKAKSLAIRLLSENCELYEVLELAIISDLIDLNDTTLIPSKSALAEIAQLLKLISTGEKSERDIIHIGKKLVYQVPSDTLSYQLNERFALTFNRDTDAGRPDSFANLVTNRISLLLYRYAANNNIIELCCRKISDIDFLKFQQPNIPTDPCIIFLFALKLNFFKEYDSTINILKNWLKTKNNNNHKRHNGIYFNILRLLIETILISEYQTTVEEFAVDLIYSGGILPTHLKQALKYYILSNKLKNRKSISQTGTILALLSAEPKQIYPYFENYLYDSKLSCVDELLDGRHSELHIFRFLEKVSILPVLAKSPKYKSTTEIENARIKICQFLISENHAINQMRAEIAELTQRQLIRNGITTVRRSKIYVDEDGIRRSGELLFKERFKDYQQVALNPEFKDLSLLNLDAFTILVPNSKGELVRQMVINSDDMHILSHSEFLLFKKLFLDIRDQFVGSNSHGLDSYLSIRIRHGTLQGQLRSPFEEQHLILQRSASSKDYVSNPYWVRLLGLFEKPLILEELYKAFSSFSKNIDSIISKLKDDILQVTTEVRPRAGLFDFTYKDSELLVLMEIEFRNIANLDKFIETEFGELWRRTEENLKNVRNYISNETTSAFRTSLEKLEENLRHIFPGDAASDLFKAIRKSSTSLGNTMQMVIDWFQPPSQTTPTTLPIAAAINIAVTSYRNVHPIRSINITNNVKRNHMMQGRICTPLYDLMAALLDNAFTHSGCSIEGAVVCTVIDLIDNAFSITVTNDFRSSINIMDIIKAINSKIDKLISMPIGDNVRSEGGTGFQKILKILKLDLARQQWNLKAFVENENLIAVKLSFEVEGLII